MALSKRFSNIKPIGVSSSEAEDTEDDDEIRLRLFGKTNKFKYSNPAKISFDCERTDGSTYSSENDIEDDLLGDMEASWMEEFREILGRGTKDKEHLAHHTLLCEKSVQDKYHEPLDTLKNSLEKYDKDHDENSAQIVPESTPLDINIATPCGDAQLPQTENKVTNTKQIVSEEDDEQNSPVLEYESVMDEKDIASKENSNILSKHSSDKKQYASSCTKDNEHKNSVGKENSAQTLKKVESSKSSKYSTLKSTTKPVEKTLSKGKVDNSNFESNKTSDFKHKDKQKTNNYSAYNDHSDQKKTKDNKSVKVAHTNGKIIKRSISKEESLNKTFKETGKVGDGENDDKDVKVSCDKSENNHTGNTRDRNEDHAVRLAETVSNSDLEAKDTSRLYVSKVNSTRAKEQKKSGNIHKVEAKKQKTYNIKPANSFPLDELLPMSVPSKCTSVDNNSKHELPVAGIKTSEEKPEKYAKDNFTDQNCYENISWNSTFVPDPQSWQPLLGSSNIVQENVFHGTYYETHGPHQPSTYNPVYPVEETYSHPKEDTCSHVSYEGTSYETSEPVSSTTPDQLTMSKFVSSNLSDIMMAIQNGNTSILASLQEALYQEIGTNLQVLAAKTKQQSYTKSRPKLSTNVDNFCFYQEQHVPASSEYQGDVNKGIHQKQQESEGDQSEQLFHLFVQQCQGLVQTQKDKEKLQTLIKLLKTEAKGNLTSTGFTPPDMDKMQELDSVPVLKVSVINEEVLTDYSLSPKSCVSANVVGLFEGRTLLKGGVKPRHIPKTVSDKKSHQRPRDPRTQRYKDSVMELRLPPFVKEMWGQEKYDKIIALGEVSGNFSLHTTTLDDSNIKQNGKDSYYNPNEALTKTSEINEITMPIMQSFLKPLYGNQNIQYKESHTKTNIRKSSDCERNTNEKMSDKTKVYQSVKSNPGLQKNVPSKENSKCEYQMKKSHDKTSSKNLKTIETSDKKKNLDEAHLNIVKTIETDKKKSFDKTQMNISKVTETLDKKYVNILSTDITKVSENLDNERKEEIVKRQPGELSPTGTDRKIISMDLDSDSESSISDIYWRKRSIVKESTSSDSPSRNTERSSRDNNKEETRNNPKYIDKAEPSNVRDDRYRPTHYHSVEKEKYRQHTADRNYLDLLPVTELSRSDISANRTHASSSNIYSHHQLQPDSSISDRSTSSKRSTSSSQYKSTYSSANGIKKRDHNCRSGATRSDRESNIERSSQRDSDSRDRKRHNTAQDSHTSEYKKRRYEDQSEENRRRSHGDARKQEAHSGIDRSLVDNNKVVNAYEYHRHLQPCYSQRVQYPYYPGADDRRITDHRDNKSPDERYKSEKTFTERKVEKVPVATDARSIISSRLSQNKAKKSPNINRITYSSPESYSPQFGSEISATSINKEATITNKFKNRRMDNKNYRRKDNDSTVKDKDMVQKATKTNVREKAMTDQDQAIKTNERLKTIAHQALEFTERDKVMTQEAEKSDSFSSLKPTMTSFKPTLKKISPVLKAKKTMEEDREFLQSLKKRLSGEMVEPVKHDPNAP